MADLRCHEVLNISEELPSQMEESTEEAHFCKPIKDRAILDDSRVFHNMLQLEEFYMPSPALYNEIQDEIKIHMRKIVTDWMLEVCSYQKCHPDVFLLATNIMDRFLATIKLQKKQFQLLGAASIFLASKMIEAEPIAALTLIRDTADTYDREELLSMELLILSKLKWDLTAITSYDYLDHMINTVSRHQSSSSQLSDCGNNEVKHYSENIVTLCGTDETFMSMPPSLIAASALVTAMERERDKELNNLNEIVTCVSTATKLEIGALKNCMRQIHQMIQQNTSQDLNSSECRYSTEYSYYVANNRNHPSHRSADSNARNGSNNETTPTEVFSVSALYVT